jgi:hypothetical protein
VFVPRLRPSCTSIVILPTDAPGSARCRACQTVVHGCGVTGRVVPVPARLRAMSPNPPLHTRGLLTLHAAYPWWRSGDGQGSRTRTLVTATSCPTTPLS